MGIDDRTEVCASLVTGEWILEGLHCHDCAARVEKAVASLPGVRRATVGFPSGLLRAEYSLEEVGPEDILSKIVALGYRAKGSRAHRQDRPACHAHGCHEDHGGHDHPHDHAHHARGHSHHDHSHSIHVHSHEGHSHAGGMWAPLMGALGLAAGFLAERAGQGWYWVPFVLGAVVAGIPVARAGFRALMGGGGADINLLTTIAGAGALLIGEYGEAAAVMTLFSIGEFLEEKASEKARTSIQALMDLSPRTARVKRGDALVEVEASAIAPGDIVVVFPGEMIPADGYVVKGESSVDESSLTGESVPVDKGVGSRVFAGSLNGEGALELRAERTAEDTTVSRIIAMVQEAQAKKARSQRMVDVFARYWTPAMVLLSLVIALGVPLVLKAEFRPWIYRGLTVLIVSCPCSLVISTPVTVVAAIARAARFGVLVKGGIHLEDLGKVKAVAFDKTGTITMGRIAVSRVSAKAGAALPALAGGNGGGEVWEMGPSEPVVELAPGPAHVLALAAAVEARSEHPLARAIVAHAEKMGLDFEPVEHFVSIRGKGAKARVGERNVYVGNERLFGEMGVHIPEDLVRDAALMRERGETAVFVGTGQEVLGVIGLADEVRPDASHALAELRNMGIATVMLTGDEEATARRVASQTGVGSYSAGLMPEDKKNLIAALKEEHGTVAMVGDGVNDAPSLAAADVGIAMGAGADVALETADVALLKDSLSKVPWALRLGGAARLLIAQNVAFSLVVKGAALALVLAGILPLWVAVLSDSGAAVLVTLNGLRILRHE